MRRTVPTHGEGVRLPKLTSYTLGVERPRRETQVSNIMPYTRTPPPLKSRNQNGYGLRVDVLEDGECYGGETTLRSLLSELH